MFDDDEDFEDDESGEPEEKELDDPFYEEDWDE